MFDWSGDAGTEPAAGMIKDMNREELLAEIDAWAFSSSVRRRLRSGPNGHADWFGNSRRHRGRQLRTARGRWSCPPTDTYSRPGSGHMNNCSSTTASSGRSPPVPPSSFGTRLFSPGGLPASGADRATRAGADRHDPGHRDRDRLMRHDPGTDDAGLRPPRELTGVIELLRRSETATMRVEDVKTRDAAGESSPTATGCDRCVPGFVSFCPMPRPAASRTTDDREELDSKVIELIAGLSIAIHLGDGSHLMSAAASASMAEVVDFAENSDRSVGEEAIDLLENASHDSTPDPLGCPPGTRCSGGVPHDPDAHGLKRLDAASLAGNWNSERLASVAFYRSVQNLGGGLPDIVPAEYGILQHGGRHLPGRGEARDPREAASAVDRTAGDGGYHRARADVSPAVAPGTLRSPACGVDRHAGRGRRRQGEPPQRMKRSRPKSGTTERHPPRGGRRGSTR